VEVNFSLFFVLQRARDLVFDRQGVHSVSLEETLSVDSIFQGLDDIPFQSGAVYHVLLEQLGR
jgi:hypothetical protein